ncbi:universal stress protein [Coralliovum pocilloporae]|uniref:universal stress protein n=1 Tax=Coralliovum pocilloporae TaxID=3066369 RepID=UPI0033077F60
MSKTVLCAVDISNKTQDTNVLEQAARLAEMDQAQLDVITVVPDYGMSIVSGYFDEQHHEKLVDGTRKALEELVAGVLGKDKAASVRHIVATGNAYEEILRTADADGAELIVIGAHKPNFRDFLLGPNAARVVRHSNCSVYVVR